MAPEVQNGGVFNGQKADIFSLGVLLYIMAYGKPPFSGDKGLECPLWKLRVRSNDARTFFSTHPTTRFNYKVDPLLKELLFKMLSPEPNKRPSITDIVQNEFFNSSEYPMLLV